MIEETDNKIADIASSSLHSLQDAEISVSGVSSENIIGISCCSRSDIRADFIEISL